MRLEVNKFRNKKTLIGGIQGSGKTFGAKTVCRNFRTLLYTPHIEEWVGEPNNIAAYPVTDFINEFPDYCRWVKEKVDKIDLMCVDEADMVFRSHFDTSPAFRDLVINHRHYNLGIIAITRRLQDIPARFYGSFENFMLFFIEAPQVTKILNEYAPNLGDMVASLDFNKHEFIWKEIGCKPQVGII